MISIIDYGMGNLRSVQKAFEKLDVAANICTSASEAAAAECIVLPGVGAFRDAMAELRRQDYIGPLRDHIAAGKPFLGICLGLQLLFEVSHEDGQWEGLGVLPGEVVRFADEPGLKVPHMGWNTLEQMQPSPLLEGLPPDPHVYFVHSYYVVPRDDSVVLTYTTHGTRFVSAVQRGRLFATQFHPEKSQRVDLKILENFAALSAGQ